MKKRSLIIAIASVLLVATVFFTWTSVAEEPLDIYTQVQKGDFRISVTTTGELEAKNSVRVQGPTGMRTARIWEVKLNKLVAEGTVVDKGEFIAELDKSQVIDKLREEQTDLTKAESQYTQTQLDTALELREARDNLINLNFSVEEKKLVLEQSEYEPPATIKQAEIDLDKAVRALAQAKENYEIKVNQAIAKMQEVNANLQSQQNKVDFLNKLMNEFIILAPEDGMVIYARTWNGTKKREGSTVSAWDPTVATLPDLTKMVSKTYVNEVDIRKIKIGQKVDVGLDAFPEKGLTGEVVTVANVGEQKPNSDAKVFEVSIAINEVDTTLRPSMTTSNIIMADIVPDALFVPLEAIQSQGDSLTYVYKKDGLGIIKQEVEIGKTNENEVIVLNGLKEEDVVALSDIEGKSSDNITLINKEEKIAKN